MRHTAPVSCDFCHGPIDIAKPWTSLNVVVPDDVGVQVRDEWRRIIGQTPSGGPLGLVSFVQTPTHCSLDICHACEQERLPDLRPMVAVMLLTQLEQQRAKAASRTLFEP